VLGLLVLMACPVRGQAAILRVPRDYPSIQAALAAARTGDTVLVAAGIYHESLTMKPGVRLQGEPGAILDGRQTSGPLVSARSGVERTAVLSGFVIRYGQHAGILLNQAAPTIRNNVITQNRGPGIACLQASPHIVNNIITRNGDGGIVCKYPNTAPTIVYNDVWQNQPTDYQGCIPGEGNLHQEPRFRDAQHDDYRLRDDSPLIDAGHPAAALRDTDGSRSDMGIGGGPLRRPWHRLGRAPGGLQNSLSFQGLPGLIDIPTATMVPSGSVDMEYNVKRDRNVFPGIDAQKNFSFAIGLLPRITIGGRGTVTSKDGRDQARDISANVQILLLEEGLWWPAVAIGLQDISGGNNLFESDYLVLSKSLFGRVRGTVGFGTGPDTLEGLFAGAELKLNRFITLMGEYDTDDINVGIRLLPLPKKLEAYGIPRPTVDLIWQDGNDFTWGVSLRSILGEAKFQAQRAARAHKRYQRWTQPPDLSLQAISDQLQATLLARGLENVRVTMVPVAQGTTAVVEYENRRYNRNELDGLGLVLGLTATRTPPSVTHMSIIVKEVNLPVLQFTTSMDDYLAFINEQMSERTFARRVHITQQVQWPAEMGQPAATTAIGNRSWLKVDAFLRPGIATRILTERGVADMRFSLLPDAFMQLFPGMVVNLRANIPVTQTPNFPGRLDDPEVDRVLLHQTLRLPLGKWSPFITGLTQFSVGRFSGEEVGIANETALTFLEGWIFVKSAFARLGSSFSALDHWVALGNGRLRYPPWDLTLSVTAGQFLDGDRGIATDLSRFFGNTEIGVFFRHSDNGSLAGLRLGIPLTPARELKPMRFRPRPPDLFTYEQRTTVLTERNVVRNDIGRTLRTDHEIERVYWNRDRLYPVYIRQHIDTLKQAIRKWVDEGNGHITGRKQHATSES
jgi:hypothetical protein